MIEPVHNERLDAAVRDAAEGSAPVNIALMRVLIEAARAEDARSAFARARAVYDATADRQAAARIAAVEQLWGRHREAWTVVRSTIAAVAHERHDASPEEALRYWEATFDRLAAASPEASVALNSLGSPDLLAGATAEIVAFMEAERLITPQTDVLDFGCGIGRFAAALAPKVRHVLGLDLSAAMIAEAERRCEALPNVTLAHSRGGFAVVEDNSRDLVLAADVFPYLVQAGLDVARRHVVEIARVLRPHGRGLVLNYSYRGDFAIDRAELGAAAAAAGLTVVRDGACLFELWDGAAFILGRDA